MPTGPVVGIAAPAEDVTHEQLLQEYRDPSGLILSLSCLPLKSDGPTDLVIFSGGGGPITSHLAFQQRVRKGAKQLPRPEEGTPGMVVVCLHSDIPATGLELIGAMFGLPAVSFETGGMTVELSGVYRPDKNTRLSAVAQYSDRPERLDVVHNLFAENSIDPERLSVSGIRQLIPDGPGRMRWTET